MNSNTRRPLWPLSFAIAGAALAAAVAIHLLARVKLGANGTGTPATVNQLCTMVMHGKYVAAERAVHAVAACSNATTWMNVQGVLVWAVAIFGVLGLCGWLLRETAVGPWVRGYTRGQEGSR